MIQMEEAAKPEEKWKRIDEEAADEEETAPPSPEAHLWQIGAGAFIMVAGVVVPALVIAGGCAYSFEGIWRLTLLHPVETILEAILVLTVPVANLEAWRALCHNSSRHPIRLGIMNGIAVAVPALTLAISAASFALSYPLIDSATKESHALSLSLLGVCSVPALIAAAYLTHLLRKAKHTRDAKIRTIVYSLMGVGLTLISLIGAELRSTFIRVAETYALSDDTREREFGLAKLRECGPEKELKMICADQHAAGLAGMFMPLDTSMQKRLYFAATGKPYRDRQSTNMSLMSNDYLRNHVVGALVDGLSLHRSAIFGKVHPQTLSSTLNWEFIFKNRSYVNQEARAELALPEGAVISDLTIWVNGVPCSGSFGATENAGSFSNSITVQHRDPALITDLGRGRYLMQASPVPGQGEMKVKVAITEPLKLDGSNNASFGIPRFIDSNFTLNGHHNITLRSSEALSSTVETIKPAVTSDGVHLLTGELDEKNISKSPFAVKMDNPVQFKSIAIQDPFSNKVVFEELKVRNGDAPHHLIVVVDSSQAMKERIDEVINALERIPAQIETSVILAGDKESSEAFSREEGIKRLKSNNFGGGQDNLFALVKAAERAGESSGGAVLWIHGPQPGYNNEMYLMAPYASPPRFFEMALDDCLTDVNEFFKNHKEVGPFIAIPRTGPVGDDLKTFLSKWQPGAKETYVDLTENTGKSTALVADKEAAREVSILFASKNVQSLLATGKTTQAAHVGVSYHIVTPVSGAVVLEQHAAIANANAHQAQPSSSASNAAADSSAVLQAQNAPMPGGTVGPQGADATVIQGINTAGTIRVNNLANLEALLNIFANGGEIFGLILGIYNVVVGMMSKSMFFPCKLSPKGRIVFGLFLALAGLALPGCFNWLVASARDANLFD